MSMLEARRTSEPDPPRPLALRPSPSARNVVGKWGTSAGSTMATPRAPTPTTRPSVANAVVGSASGPDDECGDAVPQARSERTPCRPTSASQARAPGTAYQAPRPSPELVAEARNADSSGMPASAGLRYVTPIASTATAVRPMSRLMARIVPRLDGAGAV